MNIGILQISDIHFRRAGNIAASRTQLIAAAARSVIIEKTKLLVLFTGILPIQGNLMNTR
jgi:hypothetical protein